MHNRNPETGIRYGYISANSLHYDVLDALQAAECVQYKEALDELRHRIYCALAEAGVPAGEARNEVCDEAERVFELYYEYPDEAIHEGELDGVKYRTSWLGGALHIWIFDSPYTGYFDECSPCVPGAGLLTSENPNGGLTYDVPKEWRDEDQDK